MKKYIAYHCHSDLSNMTIVDSPVSPMQYVERIKELEHTTYVSTEHGVSYGWAEKYLLCQKHGIKFVFGVEIYVEFEEKPYHMMLIAKNMNGLKQINRAVNEAVKTNWVSNRPRVTLEMIEKFIDHKNVYATTSCIMGVLREPTGELFEKLRIVLKDSLMIEVQANMDERQLSLNKVAKDLAKQYGLKLIAGTDSHIIYPHQSQTRTELIVGKGIHYNDDESEDGFLMDYPDYDTLFARFQKQQIFTDDEISDFIDRTNIFEQCDDIVLNTDFKVPTLYPHLTRAERCEKFISDINDEWEQYKLDENISADEKGRYIKAIKDEISEWIKCGMEDYPMTARAIVKRGIEKGGVLTKSGRGSAASYITNMLFGFTTIDRLKTKVPLLQQRFITAEKVLREHSCPDIDFNVANITPFVEAQEELLGENKSFPLVAFGTLKTRSAFKMLCKVNGDIPVDLQNEMSKKIEEYERDLKHAEEGSEDEIKIEQYLTDPKLKQIYDNGNEFFGIRVDRKRHASAFCIADHDVAEIFGLLKTPAGDIVLNLEGRFMDDLGYVKLDWLIVNVVDMIKVVYDEIGIPVPSTKELRALVENDKPTWDIYKNGITCCVNQVEQKKTRAKVMKYAPQTVEELTSFVAAVRPAFQSYYHRFERREHFSFGLEALDKLLQGEFLSDSWILYQEQIMLLVIWLGFDVGESADLMKAISKKKKDKINMIKGRFEDRLGEIMIRDILCKGEKEDGQ